MGFGTKNASNHTSGKLVGYSKKGMIVLHMHKKLCILM